MAKHSVAAAKREHQRSVWRMYISKAIETWRGIEKRDSSIEGGASKRNGKQQAAWRGIEIGVAMYQQHGVKHGGAKNINSYEKASEGQEKQHRRRKAKHPAKATMRRKKAASISRKENRSEKRRNNRRKW